MPTRVNTKGSARRSNPLLSESGKMSLYRAAEMKMFYADTSYFGDSPVSVSCPCEVRIGDGTITISYRHENGYAVYKGTEIEPGHYKLACENPKGRATLHRFAGDETLEGWYIETGLEGMWRVELNDDRSA